MSRPQLQGLYGITPSSLLDSDRKILTAVTAALQGGMRWLQYRAKGLNRDKRLRQAEALSRLCREHGAGFIINDDVELALQVIADGVHLGREDGSIERARDRLGDAFVLGVSCYNEPDRALAASAAGADYIAFGRFFPSRTKPQAVQADPALLAWAHRETGLPVCAIGGITIDNAGKLLDQGADLLAVVDGLFSADDIRERARAFSSLIAQQPAE